jgi:hypothetical protein
MKCAGDDSGMSSASVQASGNAGETDLQPAVKGMADNHRPDGYGCSCDSCYSTAPLTTLVALQAELTPEAVGARPALLTSVVPEPLVPPPQLLS